MTLPVVLLALVAVAAFVLVFAMGLVAFVICAAAAGGLAVQRLAVRPVRLWLAARRTGFARQGAVFVRRFGQTDAKLELRGEEQRPAVVVLGPFGDLDVRVPGTGGPACGAHSAFMLGEPLLLAAFFSHDVRTRLGGLAARGQVSLTDAELTFVPRGEIRTGDAEALVELAGLLDVHDPVRVTRARLLDPEEDPAVRHIALAGLIGVAGTRCGLGEATAAACAVADDADAWLALQASTWLVRGGRDGALPLVARALQGLADAARPHGAEVVAGMLKGAEPALMPALREALPALRAAKQLVVRCAALDATPALGGPEDLPELAERLARSRDADEVRAAAHAVGALGSVGHAGACAALTRALRRPRASDGEITTLADAIGRIGTVAHVAALREIQANYGPASPAFAELDAAIEAIQARAAGGAGRLALPDLDTGRVAIADSGAIAIVAEKKS